MNKSQFVKYLSDKYHRMFLTKSETAHELDVTHVMIDNLRRSGELKSRKAGSKVLIDAIEIADYLKLS